MPDHSGFIIAAYGFATLVTLMMIFAVVSDYWRQRAALARLESQNSEQS